MWRNHSDGVPDVLIDNANILSQEAGEAALRLRRRYMRTGYVPRDVPESATNLSSELHHESIHVLNYTHSDSSETIEGTVSHTTDEDNTSFTDDVSDSGPLNYIPPIVFDNDEDEMVEEYPEHDMPGDFPVSLSHNLLDVTTEDVKQFVAIHALKKLSSIRNDDHSIESEGETVEDSDEWSSSEDTDDNNSADEISVTDSESNNEIGDDITVREQIEIDSFIPVWERVETQDDEIAIEQGKKLVATYADKPAEDIDPLWFLLVFPDCFPNGQGLPTQKVSVKRWLSYLIQIDGSPFQSNAFVCAAGDWIMRHGVNLAAHLQFKTSPKLFEKANKATTEHIKRAAQILAKRGRPVVNDPDEVKALCKQVVAVSARTIGSPYNAITYRRQMFAGWSHFGAPFVFFTINPLETRSPFCWKLCGANIQLQRYPNPGESQPTMLSNDFEMIKLVRSNPVAQAIFFRIVLKLFRKIACGFSKPDQYSQDVDENGKPMGFFGPIDFVALKAEESGRMAQHAHGLICSRFFKLHNIIDLMEMGSQLVMNWMGCVASSVMGPRLVSRSEDNFGPLNRMPKLWKEGIDSMDDILEIPKRNRSLLLSTLLPSVENLDDEVKISEMHNYLACMKHEQVMHAHSSRCIPHTRMGKGDNNDCAGGFKPGPPNIEVHTWDSESKQLSLARDRTKLISHNVPTLLFLKSNINFIIMGDKSARQPNDPEEDQLSFGQMVKYCCYYTTKYDTKVDIHAGEQLILNLIMSHQRTEQEAILNKPKLLITRLSNALNG